MDDKDRRKLLVGILILILFFINLIGEVMRDRTLRRWALTCLGVMFGGLAVLIFLFWFVFHIAFARDYGQFEGTDPAIRQWYKTLMMPDIPQTPCCGESDAYWADSYEVSKDGEYIAIITDDRPDEPLRRRHIDVGTRIVIPNHKLKYDQSNPTGHGIVFTTASLYVYCYVAPGGV